MGLIACLVFSWALDMPSLSEPQGSSNRFLDLRKGLSLI